MPTIPTLSGSYIDETYQRLVQVSGSSFADGLGNPITLGTVDTGSLVSTASFNDFTSSVITTGSTGLVQSITGSVTVTGSIELTGSISVIDGYFVSDGTFLTNLPTQVEGSSGEIQYNISGSSFGGIPILTYDGTTVTATNINATGSFSGSFSGSFNDGVQKLILTGVTQTGISGPTYVIAENTFGDTFTFGRTNAGQYELIFDNITPFTEDYTYAIISPGFASPITNAYSTFYEWLSISRIKFWTVKNGTSGNDDVLVKATIEIRVYPTP